MATVISISLTFSCNVFFFSIAVAFIGAGYFAPKADASEAAVAELDKKEASSAAMK